MTSLENGRTLRETFVHRSVLPALLEGRYWDRTSDPCVVSECPPELMTCGDGRKRSWSPRSRPRTTRLCTGKFEPALREMSGKGGMAATAMG